MATNKQNIVLSVILNCKYSSSYLRSWLTNETNLECVTLKTNLECVTLKTNLECVTLKTNLECVTLKTNLECVTLKTTHKLIGEELSNESAVAAAADSTVGPPGSTAAMGIVGIHFY
jgi:hypothetical protein